MKKRSNSHTTYEHVEDRKQKAEAFLRRVGKDDAADNVADMSVEDYAAKKGFIIENPVGPSPAQSKTHIHRRPVDSHAGRDHRRAGARRKRRAGGTNPQQGSRRSRSDRAKARQSHGTRVQNAWHRADQTATNPLFGRSEKKRFKKKLKGQAKAGLRSLLSRLTGVPLSSGLGRGVSHTSAKRPKARQSRVAQPPSGVRSDVISALVNQGFSRKEAERAAAAAGNGDFAAMFRKAIASRRPNPGPYWKAWQAALDKAAKKAGPGVAARVMANRQIIVVVRGTPHRFDDINEALGFLDAMERRPNPARRKRRNGQDEQTQKAKKVFKDFHQAEPDRVFTVIEKMHDAGTYALLGRLLGYDMVDFPLQPVKQGPNVNTWHANINLCSDPEARQLHLWGGDQNMEYLLPEFGITSDVQLVDLGEIRRIWYVTQKGMHDFQPTEYHHRFGEEGGRRPRLMYDRLNRRQFIVGGDYKIEPRGVAN